MSRMRQVLFLFLLLAVGGPADAALLDAFPFYIEARQLEEELQLLPFQIEDKSERAPLLQARRAKAQAAYAAELRRDSPAPGWSASIAQALLASKKPPAIPTAEEAQAVALIKTKFPNARQFSALEWSVIREWFGREVQETFLRETFSMQELNKAPSKGKGRLIWILDPYRKLLHSSSGQDTTPYAAERKTLENLGYQVDILQLTAFEHVEDQAEELKHFLFSQLGSPFTLVTAGDASAILLKTLDLYPSLRANEKIQAWLNVGGRLYGLKPQTGRSPASLGRENGRAELLTQLAKRELHRLHQGSLQRRPPLGKGFPIINIISLDKKHRSSEDLTYSLVQEGETWFLRSGAPATAVANALALTAP